MNQVNELKDGDILELTSRQGSIRCLVLNQASKISWALLPTTTDCRMQLVGDVLLSDDKLPQSPLLVATDRFAVARTVDLIGSSLWGCLSDPSQLSAVRVAGKTMARALADLSRQQRGEGKVAASNIPCLFPVYTALGVDPFALRGELIQLFQEALAALPGEQ